MKRGITEASVKAHNAATHKSGKLVDAVLWDAELKGFGCNATPAGKRSFFVQYRLGGRAAKVQKVHIGHYGPLTVTQGRVETVLEGCAQGRYRRTRSLHGKAYARVNESGIVMSVESRALRRMAAVISNSISVP
jgi:hypothetical protein